MMYPEPLTRDELFLHLVFDHQEPTVPGRSTEELILNHEIDHESARSVKEGLSAHRHSEPVISGISVVEVLKNYTGPRDPEARF